MTPMYARAQAYQACLCCHQRRESLGSELCQTCNKEIDDDMIGMHWELFFNNRKGDRYDV
tara:strand:- start:78 stop:257 length:180 start_codon:yes stop_codon:yes gene_type:complete